MIDLASVGRFVIWNRPLHGRMGGVCNNVLCKVYSEVEIDDELGVGLGVSVAMSKAVVVTLAVAVGVDDAGSGFLVGATYVEVVCWRSR